MAGPYVSPEWLHPQSPPSGHLGSTGANNLSTFPGQPQPFTRCSITRSSPNSSPTGTYWHLFKFWQHGCWWWISSLIWANAATLSPSHVPNFTDIQQIPKISQVYHPIKVSNPTPGLIFMNQFKSYRNHKAPVGIHWSPGLLLKAQILHNRLYLCMYVLIISNEEQNTEIPNLFTVVNYLKLEWPMKKYWESCRNFVVILACSVRYLLQKHACHS